MAGEKCVVVGAGSISGAWFPPLKAEGVEVAAVVDLSLEAATRRINEFNLTAIPSTDLAATLKKVRPDFVVDLTIPEAHCKVTCAALKAGCHVIGEKPMAATLAEARKMVRMAERAGRMYMVNQSRRWYAQHLALRTAVDAGRIGPLTTLNCDFYIGAHFGGFRDRMASPLVLDMAIHHFDLARYLSGADPVAVYAHEFNPRGSWYDGDAAATCVFEMTGGVVFTYRGSWCSEGCHTSWNGDWRAIGTTGTLLCERDGAPRGQVAAGDQGFHRPLKDVAEPMPEMKYPTMHGALREMLDYLRTGRTPQTECHDNIKSLAMVFAAIKSSATGKRVPVVGLAAKKE